jgi:hypothetical protein
MYNTAEMFRFMLALSAVEEMNPLNGNLPAFTLA